MIPLKHRSGKKAPINRVCSDCKLELKHCPTPNILKKVDGVMCCLSCIKDKLTAAGKIKFDDWTKNGTVPAEAPLQSFVDAFRA